jgi:hypothetical protein
MAREIINAAHSSPTRAYLLDAMVCFYGVCTLSSRARRFDSQLITRKGGNEWRLSDCRCRWLFKWSVGARVPDVSSAWTHVKLGRLSSKSLAGEGGNDSGDWRSSCCHFTSLHGLTRAPNLDRARSPQKTLIEKTPGRIHLQYTRTPTSQQNTNSRHRSVTRKNTERRIPQKIDAQAAHTEGNPGRKLQLDLKDVGREKTCLLRELTVGEARKARSERKRACNDQWLEQ